MLHYPRLSPTTSIRGASGQQGTYSREHINEIASPLATLALHAAFVAMPHIDENDGQTVLCYRSYFPAALAAIY